MSNTPSRVCSTHKQLEELVLDITQHDLNLQMQQLISEYKKTGEERLLIDAEYLRSEYDSWWDSEKSEFVAPEAQL